MQLKDWTFLGNYDFFNSKLRTMVTNDLPPEKWSYAGKDDFGILRSYLYFTFEKVWQEREDAEEVDKQQFIYMDEEVACFNTGLYDKTWQSVYFYCVKNPIDGFQPWRFTTFYNSYTIKYSDVPTSAVASLRRANYFDDPSALIFDVNLDIVPQWDHILYDEENFQRIPKQLRANGREFCQNVIDGAIRAVKNALKPIIRLLSRSYIEGKFSYWLRSI